MERTREGIVHLRRPSEGWNLSQLLSDLTTILPEDIELGGHVCCAAQADVKTFSPRVIRSAGDITIVDSTGIGAGIIPGYIDWVVGGDALRNTLHNGPPIGFRHGTDKCIFMAEQVCDRHAIEWSLEPLDAIRGGA